MLSTIITFLLGALFAGSISYFAQSMINQAKVPEMIKAETEKRIKDLEFEVQFVTKKLSVSERQKDIAIEYTKQTLEERNEALLMLSKRL